MAVPYTLGPMGRIAIAMLLVYAVAEAAYSWHLLQVLELFAMFEDYTVSDEEYDALHSRVNGIGFYIQWTYKITLYASFLVCGIWIYRATANAREIAPSLDAISPSWAVGWFFVPFANLFMPYKAMVQTWDGLHQGDKAWPIIGLIWWATWAVGLVLMVWMNGVNLNADSVETYRLGTLLGTVRSLLAIPTALLFCKIINDMTKASARAQEALLDPKEQQP